MIVQINMDIEGMLVRIEKEDTKLTVALKGGLDTRTSQEFEMELKPMLKGVTEFVMDFTELDYITSAGLRLLLQAAKIMETQGEMIVENPNSDVLDVFHLTGFENVLTIKS